MNAVRTNVPALKRRWLCVVAILSLFHSSSSGWDGSPRHTSPHRTIYSCNFQSAHDLNSDRQPDGWRRRKDRAHPAYISAEVVSRDEMLAAQGRNAQIQLVRAYRAWKTGQWDGDFVPETIPPFLTKLMDGVVIRNCYEVRVDGGAFEMVSPTFPIDPQLSYRFSTEFSSQNLDGHSASLELRILAANGQTISAYRSPSISGSTDWKVLESEIISLPNSSEFLNGQLHLYVHPQPNGTGKGVVRIDNIQVNELPRVTIDSDLPFNLTRPNSPFNINFQVIGQSPETDTAVIELIDIDGQVVRTDQVPVTKSPLTRDSDSKLVSSQSSQTRNQNRSQRQTTVKRQNWTSTTGNHRFIIEQPGHYTVRMKLGDQTSCETQIAVLSQPAINRGMFGWTLNNLDAALDEPGFVELAASLGVGFVKIPIWLDYRDSQKLQSLSKWLSRIANEKIVCIGTMDQPLTTGTTTSVKGADNLHAAAILSDSNLWYESVEPILTNLGMKLNWLQIGSENDRSAVGNAELHNNLGAIRNHIHAIGQDMSIAIGWDWQQPPASVSEEDGTNDNNWNALHLSSPQKITEVELLEQAKSWPKSRVQTWTSLSPLSLLEESVRQRVLSLVQQMLAIRRSEVSAAFMNPVFDDSVGLFDSQHRPSHLLLPWAHVADVISTRRYIGTLDLSNHSTIHFFENEEGTVGLMWSDNPITERVFFGEAIEANDVWGRSVKVQQVSYPSGSVATEITLGNWPIIIHKVDRETVLWQQEFQLNTQQLPSQIADKGTLSLTFQNTLPQTAEVSIAAFAKSLFEDGSVRKVMEVPALSPQQLDLGFQFHPDASAGDHSLEFAFRVLGDNERKFSIVKQIKLGHRDLELYWKMIRLSDDFVELQVQVINNTPVPVSFDCKLFPRGTPYQRVLIIDANNGTSLHTRRVPIPKSTAIQESPIWVRCEQIGSSLVLNYRLME